MPIFRGIASSSIIDGTSTLFWKDAWLDQVNAEAFPRAFSFVKDEDISVHQFLSASRLADSFHLPISPEAMEEVRSIQRKSSHIQLSDDHDIWSYPWGKQYAPSQYYKFCFREISPHESFLWLWKTKCTPRIKFFCWLVLSDRLNTRNMLKRRHFQLNSGYNCLMCNNPPEETIEHMIFHCSFSKTCWQKLQMLWDADGDRLHLLSRGRSIWRRPLFMELFMIAARNIWKERNKKLFEGVDPELASWKARMKTDLSLLVHRTKPDLHSQINQLIAAL
jgi:hypothetical protein